MSRHIIDAAKLAHPAVTPQGRDFKAWARQILYREEHGDKELTALQVNFAREALGLSATNN